MTPLNTSAYTAFLGVNNVSRCIRKNPTLQGLGIHRCISSLKRCMPTHFGIIDVCSHDTLTYIAFNDVSRFIHNTMYAAMHSMMYPHVSVQVNIDVSRCIYITLMYADVSNDVYSQCIPMYLYSTMYPVMNADVCRCIPMYTNAYRCIQHHQHATLQLWLLTLKPMHLYESQWFCTISATHHTVLNIQHVHNAPNLAK